MVLAAAVGFVGTGAPAGAAQAATWGPVVVADVPPTPTDPDVKPTQKVMGMAVVTSPEMAVGQIAYVYSTITASGADQPNLIDNEVRCAGAGAQNVVMGENVLPPSGDPANQNITITTRFLVTARTQGTIVCTQYLRTSSTSYKVARETVSGGIRFASTAVGGDASGAQMQEALPHGNLVVNPSVTTPVLDRDLPPGYTKLAIIADPEYHRCADAKHCDKGYSTARFTLTATTSGAAGCESAPVAQSQETVRKGVNHAAIPLYTIVAVKPGCNHVHAQVTTTHVGADDVGLVGGAAVGLTDETGPLGGQPNHTSAMTHLFVVPS
ncbi:hypothetical protein GCM10029964_029160 [Kibdelosporangium lantanae]